MINSLDFKTVNILIDIMKDRKNVNPIESDYIAMNLYKYFYTLNMQENLAESFQLPISENDLNIIFDQSSKYERKYRTFQLKMFFLSIIVIVAIFVIQFFIVKASIWFSLAVSLSLGFMDLYIVNKSLFPKYLKSEEKKIQNNVTNSTLKLCKKLN